MPLEGTAWLLCGWDYFCHETTEKCQPGNSLWALRRHQTLIFRCREPPLHWAGVPQAVLCSGATGAEHRDTRSSRDPVGMAGCSHLWVMQGASAKPQPSSQRHRTTAPESAPSGFWNYFSLQTGTIAFGKVKLATWMERLLGWSPLSRFQKGWGFGMQWQKWSLLTQRFLEQNSCPESNKC